MHSTILRVFAVLTFLFLAAFIWASRLPRFGPKTPEVQLRLCLTYLILIIVGAGLMFSQKWAAVLFAVATSALGLWMIVGSLLYIPWNWFMSFNLVFGALLLLPMLFTIREWDSLSLRRADRLP